MSGTDFDTEYVGSNNYHQVIENIFGGKWLTVNDITVISTHFP